MIDLTENGDGRFLRCYAVAILQHNNDGSNLTPKSTANIVVTENPSPKGCRETTKKVH